MELRNFIAAKCNFSISFAVIMPMIVALLIYPAFLFLPQTFGYENGLIENAQLLVLLVGFVICIRSKVDKKLFCFFAMVIFILVLREVNCGRTIFFAIPGEVNSFYSWKDIKYGYLAHPIYAAYMIITAVYFLKNKLFIPLINMVKNVPFPVWNILLMFIGAILGLYAEKFLDNFVLEEMCELLLYTSLVGTIYLYNQRSELIKSY